MQRGRGTKGLIWGITLLFVGTGYLLSISNLGLASTPLVSNETPANASPHVSVYLSELSFLVSDADGDTVHYFVETSPDFIAGRQGGTATSGTTIHILRRNGMLANNSTYTWWVNVTDGTMWVHNTFVFTTVSDIFQGYTLFTPMDVRNGSTFLIDINGQIVHVWPTDEAPSNGVYMADNGSILRPCVIIQGESPEYMRKIQKIAWNGIVLWEYQYSGDGYWQTHDIVAMPNGNVLILALEKKTEAESIAAGRNPALLWDNELWPAYLAEVKPTGPTSGDIVWEWHLWDHLVQDFNPVKANYGIVKDHPELLDINFAIDGYDDWIHPNTICYNPELDQVIINSRHLREFWIVDHGTTTEEAAHHVGRRHHKGGDFLYRWGNPQSYRAGNASDQKLYGPHDPQWITPGCPHEGDILIFNNGWNHPERPYSTIDEITPPIDARGNYSLRPGEAYEPENLTWQYVPPDPVNFSAGFISGCQRLPDGNTLICDGPKGFFFEVTKEGKTVWSYQNKYPFLGCRVFRVRRYYAPFIPPIAPSITGPTSGRVGIQYNYTIVSTDPDGDMVSYKIDWGDNTTATWLGPYPSGEPITVNHAWTWEKNHVIKCEAKDPYNSTSTWTTMTVIIGAPYQPSNPFPADGATGVDVRTNLSWTGGDPDPGDTTTYDVYYGIINPPPKIVSNQTATVFHNKTMDYSTTYYWKIIAWDNHGASTAGPVWEFTTVLDTTPPVTTISMQGILGEHEWYVSPVLVSLSATDLQSGVAFTMYKVDDGAWTTYTAPFTIASDGYHSIAYYSVDRIGNAEPQNSTVLKIDQVPPRTSHTYIGIMGDNGWYISLTLVFTAVDDTSGVNHTYYKLHMADPWTEYSGFSVSVDTGIYELFYYSKDNAGNNEAPKGPFPFKMDKTPPAVTLTATAEDLLKTTWLLQADASDVISGVSKVEFYVDSQKQGTVYEAPYEWNYEGSGSLAYAIVYDKAGNFKNSPIVVCQGLGLEATSSLLYLNPSPARMRLAHLS